ACMKSESDPPTSITQNRTPTIRSSMSAPVLETCRILMSFAQEIVIVVADMAMQLHRVVKKPQHAYRGVVDDRIEDQVSRPADNHAVRSRALPAQPQVP